MELLQTLELKRIFPAAVAGGFAFMFDGDYPGGHVVTYDTAGVIVPVLVPRMIRLRSLQVGFKVCASGNFLNGINVHLVHMPSNSGGGHILKSNVTSPMEPTVSWAGNMPNDWGFGVGIIGAAGFDTVHCMVVSASYEWRAL